MKSNIIAWWSGGIASAVVCKFAVETYKNVRIVFIDTKNEHDDTYRFLTDCEAVYGQKIKTIWNDKYENIQDVWRTHLALNHANGAVCSSELKRNMRVKEQDLKNDYAQIFGFDNTERERAINMSKNYPEINPIYPLLDLDMSKEDCIKEVQSWGVEIPIPYKLGYRNNNCFKTGCVQGGAGYWQKFKRENIEAFNKMADMEQELTRAKGKPVTVMRILRNGKMVNCFLKYYSDEYHYLDLVNGREPEPLIECTGFCTTKNIITTEEKKEDELF